MSMIIWIQRHPLLKPLNRWRNLDFPTLYPLPSQLLISFFRARVDNMRLEPSRILDKHFSEESLELIQGDQ